MGGGQSGAVSWPSYMQEFHHNLLNAGTTSGPTHPVNMEIDRWYDVNPFFNIHAYNPDVAVAPIQAAINTYLNFINSLDYVSNWQSAFSAAESMTSTVDDASIGADVAAFDAQLTDTLVNQTIPKFQSGMLNIGAVNTSAFKIGEAIMYGFKARDVAKHASETRLKILIEHKNLVRLHVVQMLSQLASQGSMYSEFMRGTSDGAKTLITAKKEQIDNEANLREHQYKWNLDLFAYADEALGAIGGGGGGHVAPKRQSLASALVVGNASGAAQGAAVGGWQGAIVGSVIGMGIAAATR